MQGVLESTIMEKLKTFTFNNLRWQYRYFDIAEICDLPTTPLMESWLEPFSTRLSDTPFDLRCRLHRMIGLGDAKIAQILMLAEHFVDAAGIAWPQDSIMVISEPRNEHPDSVISCLVAPVRKS